MTSSFPLTLDGYRAAFNGHRAVLEGLYLIQDARRRLAERDEIRAMLPVSTPCARSARAIARQVPTRPDGHLLPTVSISFPGAHVRALAGGTCDRDALSQDQRPGRSFFSLPSHNQTLRED